MSESATSTPAATPSSANPLDRLYALIQRELAPNGLELVHVEAERGRQRHLRVFIDRTTAGADRPEGVNLEDCVRATHALDPVLDVAAEVKEIFGDSPYELEVSSPGIDRPLRGERDYLRFQGREARLSLLRPLTGAEAGNADYAARNPKQKNYLGTLAGYDAAAAAVLLDVSPNDGNDRAGKAPKPGRKAPAAKRDRPRVRIPAALISKANLEPVFLEEKQP